MSAKNRLHKAANPIRLAPRLAEKLISNFQKSYAIFMKIQPTQGFVDDQGKALATYT